jgi:hypothetical protein
METTHYSQSWLGWLNPFSKWIGNNNPDLLVPDIHPQAPPDDLSEWEYILSNTEEFLQKHTEGQIQKTASELNSLRGASQFMLRPMFMLSATNTLGALSPADRKELETPLDSSERAKVITDIIRRFEDEWRIWIQNSFFEGDDNWGKFEHFYSEQPYTKNTVGILREVGWQASHGQDGTLPAKVLADIGWSMCNALRGSIRGALDHDLNNEELSNIANKVCAIMPSLVQLWIETVRHTKAGRAREGKLVRKWKEQEAIAKSKIASMRATGRIDGRYEGGPVSVKPWERANSKSDIAAALSSKLHFRRM